ncbi:MAG: signal recognition particle-docking protein FtsY [Clostridia bacterium]|nr:signal recognition particle-docking protein FtsY [Clostridia bacterium]MBQ2913990.1 signal recognition particle-docking protein FtsY [Clostridia bacterium]MBQ4272138.1 signal recognition particle-docking protein FtsY [Clostridia bacterium]MBQ9125903.1 signal recognition particle-docking protein FtsY [Clostridia bacterium]MBR1955432.1 signal recognition particle-docking protein FtsY [Clostridia bacterium]
MGFFQKIIDGLKKTKERIGFKLNEIFKRGIFDEDFYEELEFILLSADVGEETAEDIIDQLRERMRQDRVADAKRANQYLREVLCEILGDEKFEIQTPCVITVAGVNGVGKTTTIGKLANIFVKQGKSVVIAAADTFRAAAGEQLEVWAKRAGVRIIKHEEGSDPAAVVFDAVSSAKSKGTDIVLVDTAGRLHNKKNLMEELKKIDRVIEREHPTATRKNLIVLDATTGQNAIAQVEVFDEAIDIDGIVLTKLDGTAKGGVVLAIKHDMDIPVYFVGVGEGIDDLLYFDPQSYVEGII